MTLKERIDELVQGSHLALQDVHPVLADRVYSVIYDLAEKEGAFFGAFMGTRTTNQQLALYAQGRLPLETVNQMRLNAKLPPITAAENANRVTKVKFGLHNVGLAVDLVEDGNPEKVGIQWSWKAAKDFAKIGKYAKLHGLEWGGYWKGFVDTPHVQLTCGLSTEQCHTLYTRGGIEEVWSEIDFLLKKG